MAPPNILVIAGHDPSGGAGIAADIEAAGANGAHAATVVSLLTCQDTARVHAVCPVENAFFGRCLETACADMRFAAIKTGAIASAAQVDTIAATARAMRPTPLVVDPVLTCAGGDSLADDTVGRALRERLFPLADIITPNTGEARTLCDGETDIDRCGARLCRYGCEVLITGGSQRIERDGGNRQASNRRYRAGVLVDIHSRPRLPGVFHGSGCTLASALAARLAAGDDRDSALRRAQDYTWSALANAYPAGRGQAIPRRIAPA